MAATRWTAASSARQYKGANFPILGANVTHAKHGLPALPPFWVEIRDGMPIGFIGMPLKDVPILVDPNGIKELQVR